jgi:hypothetical protein
VTTHAATATARYLRLTVLRAEQTGTGGAARIYEFEAYGTVAPPPPSPVPSATAPSPPPPVPSPSAAPKPDPVPPPSASCFPFPAHDATQGPRPQIVLKPGVPALDKKYLDPATTIWGNQWPGAWQRFATPSALRDPNAGVNQAILTTDPHASFGDGTIEINYKDWMDSVDRGDPGMWMHESAHLIQADYPYPDFPKFYGEGITDFIRFVSHGEDPAWALISLSATDSSYFDEQKVWDSGYRQAARFLLWVTQHYDPSGAQYKLVHDLNVGASGDKPDWQGMFVQATGKSYHQLFTEYAADRKVNPHC